MLKYYHDIIHALAQSHLLIHSLTHPQYQYHWRTASEKAHFGLGYNIGGHGMDKRRMRRPL
jgi:hypothetical protein